MRTRVFWISDNSQADAHDLEKQLSAGQAIRHFGVTTNGVLVITDGLIPVTEAQNDKITGRRATSENLE